MTDPTAAVDLWNGTTDAKAVYWTDLGGKLTQDAPEIAGHSHSINKEAAKHIRDSHGNTEKEAKRGQIAITDSDIARIPEIVTDYDAIRTDLKGSNGELMVAYAKKYDDGVAIYIEGETKKGRNLRAVSMRKHQPTTEIEGILERVLKEYSEEIKTRNMSGLSGDVLHPLSVYETDAQTPSLDKDPTTGGEFSQGGIATVLQSISSADTSIRQVAAAMKKIPWKRGTVNTDIGGGRFDEGTKYLADQGVENLVFDPFNRNEQHNRSVVERLKAGQTDTATITNVLNVIAEPEVRGEVVRQAAKAIQEGGVAYFQIYEGDKSGQGKETSKGWQNNAKTETYLGEINQYFGDVKRKGNLIEARNPQPGEGPAMWMLEGINGAVEYFQSSWHNQGKRKVKYDNYSHDLFGVPDAGREDGTSERRGLLQPQEGTSRIGGDILSGRSADIRPLSRDDVPAGNYATRTELVQENTRELGTDQVNTPEDAAKGRRSLWRKGI